MKSSQLKNGKYFFGKYKSANKHKGWFIGSFLDKNNPCSTDKIEVLYREHKKGDTDELHFHKLKIEVVIILKGKIRFNVNGKDIILRAGDFLFLDINNIVSSEFLEPTKIFVIHSPSIPNDKTVVA